MRNNITAYRIAGTSVKSISFTKDILLLTFRKTNLEFRAKFELNSKPNLPVDS